MFQPRESEKERKRGGGWREKGRSKRNRHLVPVIARELMTRMPSLKASTVEQDINPVTIMQDGRHESCYAFFRRKICLVDAGFPVQFLNRSLGIRVGGIALQERKNWKQDADSV